MALQQLRIMPIVKSFAFSILATRAMMSSAAATLMDDLKDCRGKIPLQIRFQKYGYIRYACNSKSGFPCM